MYMHVLLAICQAKLVACCLSLCSALCGMLQNFSNLKLQNLWCTKACTAACCCTVQVDCCCLCSTGVTVREWAVWVVLTLFQRDI